MATSVYGLTLLLALASTLDAALGLGIISVVFSFYFSTIVCGNLIWTILSVVNI